MKDPIIRHANAGDLQAILDIYNDAILNTTAVYQEEVHTLAMREEWYADKLMQGYPVFVAELDGIVVGFCTYGKFRMVWGYRFTVEHSIYIHAGHRGKGIGKQLVLKVIDHARAKGMHVMIAGIDAASEGSLYLHRSLGFKEVAHFEQVRNKFGKWLDLKFMQLILSEKDA